MFECTGRHKFEPPVAPAGFAMWQYSKLQILHLCDYRTPNVFECGRGPGAFHASECFDPDGTVAYAGSVSRIGKSGRHVIDLCCLFCMSFFMFGLNTAHTQSFDR